MSDRSVSQNKTGTTKQGCVCLVVYLMSLSYPTLRVEQQQKLALYYSAMKLK